MAAIGAPPSRLTLAGTIVAVTVLAAVVLALAEHAIPSGPARRALAALVDALAARRVAAVGARAERARRACEPGIA